ncbi:MAG TPA: hypothetical protein VGA59_08645 [Ramlibacter sp.]|jgi:hypothetical protein
MNQTGQATLRHSERPTHAVPRKYIEPIMYLAERMSMQDKLVPAPGRRVVDQLAEALHMKDFRRQPWFRSMSDQHACELIDLETVKRATLIVIALVMKGDTARGDAAKAYFTRVRELMGVDSIAVPADMDAHMDLTLRHLVG